jgi:hypothetical protein
MGVDLLGLVTTPIVAGQDPSRGQGLLWRMSHRLMPRRIPNLSDALSSARFHVERDPAENRRTTPPDDERIDLTCIWITEIYGPSQLPHLLSAVGRLGWDRDEHTTPLIREGITQWVTRTRLHPTGGSWLNLGTITRPAASGYPGGPRHAPLPAGVDHADGSIRVLTPALTCLTMRFHLESTWSTALDRAVREPLPTLVRPIRRGLSIESPQLRKRRRVASNRQQLREQCASWFQDQAPGTFSAFGLPDAWPTIELLSLKKGAPFDGSRTDGWDYRSTLSVANDTEAWLWGAHHMLRFSPLSSIEPPNGNYFVLGFNVDEASRGIDLSGYGEESVAEAVSRRMEHEVEPLMAALAGQSLLACNQRSLAQHRDTWPKQRRTSSRQAAVELESFRELLLAGSDAQVAAVDISRYTTREEGFVRNMPHLVPADTDIWKGFDSYADLLRKTMAADAQRAKENFGFFQESLGARANAVSALVNLRLQRRLGWLTWVLILLAAATLFLAAAQFRSSNPNTSPSSWVPMTAGTPTRLTSALLVSHLQRATFIAKVTWESKQGVVLLMPGRLRVDARGPSCAWPS